MLLYYFLKSWLFLKTNLFLQVSRTVHMEKNPYFDPKQVAGGGLDTLHWNSGPDISTGELETRPDFLLAVYM